MLNLSEALRSWEQVPPEVRRLVGSFTSSEWAGRRYVLGRNEHSEALLKVLDVDGVVDDFAEAGTVWCGKPVVKGTDVPAGSIIVNCSLSISPVSAARRLESLDVAGVLALTDLCRALPDRVRLPEFVRATREDLGRNEARWRRLSDAFADEQSRQVLDDLLGFRVTGDYSRMTAYSVRLRDQYFEDFVGFGAGEVFVDAGGFDGDTTEEFCRRCPDYRQVFLFEPSAHNMEKARVRLAGLHSISFIESALSDAAGCLSFIPDAGSASSVSGSGSCRIQATTLDIQVQETVSFIKMDLEGWELKALEGARRHLLEDHPKLAIAVYHHPSDFWRIFEFVTALRPDYRVYLRHYTEGWSETVMYFVP